MKAEWSIELRGLQLPLGSRLLAEVFDLTLLSLSSKMGYALAFEKNLGRD